MGDDTLGGRSLHGAFDGEDGTLSRRRFLEGAAATGVTAIAGCVGDGTSTEQTPSTDQTQRPTTEATPTDTTEGKETTTTREQPTKQELLEDIKETRASLTESQKQARYESGIPEENNYSIEADLNSADTRREQIIRLIEYVGEDYDNRAYPHGKVEGTRAMMHALHNELDWMNWEEENIVNIVTRYNSEEMHNLNANYSTEAGGRNLDAMFAHGDASGEDTFYEDVTSSEITDGDIGNYLISDVDMIREAKAGGNIEAEGWENIQMTMQSIIPGVLGPDLADENGPVSNSNILFDGDAMDHIGTAYDDSPEAVKELSEASMEIEMSTENVRNSGRYVGVTVGEDGLEVDAIYSQEEGREKMREPVDI